MQLFRMAAAVLAAVLFASGASAQDTVHYATDSTSREVWHGQETGSAAGLSLDRGDVNSGDNRRDLIVGAPGWGSSTGRVYVVFAGPIRRGHVSLANASVTMTGAAAGDRFGEATAAGYITAYEFASPAPTRDLVVGAPGANGNAGAVYVYQRGLTLGQNLTTANALVTIIGAPAGARLGSALATGDMDGDGYREIIAGAPGIGTVFVIRGGAAIGGTIDLSVPSAAFFRIEGAAADGFGRSVVAGDLTGHGYLARTSTIYDLAIGAYNEAGGGAVYVFKGRTANTFPGTMNAATESDARFGGVDAGDRAGWALEVAPFDRDGIFDLIIGAPHAAGPGNSRSQAGEVYVIWGSAALASRSLGSADVTIYGAAAGHQEGSDLAYGSIARGVSSDIVSVAPGASAAGELHVLIGRARSGFPTHVYDFATTVPDRRLIGDPAAGALSSAIIYDLTGEGFEDVVAGAPNVAEGSVYVSFSPSYQDVREPNDAYTISTTLTPAVPMTSYVFTHSDVDWFKFTTREASHLRLTLAVPDGADYNMEFYDAVSLRRTSLTVGNGADEEILATIPAGTYYVRIVGGGTFSQSQPYVLRAVTSSFGDAFEPNGTMASAPQIGTLPYQARIFSLDDIDWYRLRVTTSGTVTIQLSVPASIDYQLVLYSSAGAVIAQSQNGAGIAETITQALSAGDYYVRVSSGGSWSDTANYTLTASGAGLANPAIPNLLLGQGRNSGGAGGWFAVHGGAEHNFGSSRWGRVPWDAYNASGGLVRLATGDVDGDGLDEVVAGLGSGSNGWIVVLDDAAHNYAQLAWLRIDWPTYVASNGEAFPAVGDIDGDGRAEIVVGLGNGGRGWILLFDDATQNYRSIGWRQVQWPAYVAGPGPTHPAVGDIDGDGVSEIVVGLGPGSNGFLAVLNGGTSNYSHRGWIQSNWTAYNSANGTTYPALGDLDADGRAEIVIGLGAQSQGWFQIVDDGVAAHAPLTWKQLSWPAYNAHLGETHPAVGNIDGDPDAEIVIGLGPFPGNGGWFEVFDSHASTYASRGWRNVGFTALTQSGAGLYPAIAQRR